MRLIAKVLWRDEEFSWEGAFSGWRMPGRVRARRRWWVGGGKRFLAWAAAAEMDSSSLETSALSAVGARWVR